MRRKFLTGLLVVVVAGISLFAAGAFTYQSPNVVVAIVLIALWLALTFACWRWSRRNRAAAAAAYALAVVALLVWWGQIEPRNDRVWSPEMARNLTYERTGDRITVNNVRNFHWTGAATADEKWETRGYNLSELKSVDVLTLLWKGPAVGHTYFSFVWNDGQALSISVEIRKELGEAYSPIGGFFKAYELAILAGDERDFYGWRTFFPKEDIQLYRTRATGAQAASMLLSLLDDANKLDKTPAFYNTATDNCTTDVWRFTETLGAGRPFGWGMVMTGHLPEFLHGLGLLDSSQSFETLESRSHILPRAKAALEHGVEGPAFSAAIRENVASPH